MSTQQPLSSVNRIPLGEIIKAVLEEKQMSSRALAREANVSIATISNLMKVGTGDEETGVHPLVLQKVAMVLDLNQVELFIAAGYIKLDDDEQFLPSLSGEYVRLCFETLSAEKQKTLLNVLHSLMDIAETNVQADQTEYLLATAAKLREKHGLYQRPFGPRRTFSSAVTNLMDRTKNKTRRLMLKNVVERFSRAYDPEKLVEPKIVVEIAKHPNAMVILNFLMPRQELTTGLEKLYWLFHEGSTAGKRGYELPEEDRAAIRDLWELLQQVTK